MKGTLYLISSKAVDLHKIGITRHWERRCKELEIGLKTDLVNRWTVNSPEQLESYLHHRFKPHRLPQSEWFHLSADQVAWVISAASKAADDHQHATAGPYRHPAPSPIARPAASRKGIPLWVKAALGLIALLWAAGGLPALAVVAGLLAIPASGLALIRLAGWLF